MKIQIELQEGQLQQIINYLKNVVVPTETGYNLFLISQLFEKAVDVTNKNEKKSK